MKILKKHFLCKELRQQWLMEAMIISRTQIRIYIRYYIHSTLCSRLKSLITLYRVTSVNFFLWNASGFQDFKNFESKYLLWTLLVWVIMVLAIMSGLYFESVLLKIPGNSGKHLLRNIAGKSDSLKKVRFFKESQIYIMDS